MSEYPIPPPPPPPIPPPPVPPPLSSNPHHSSSENNNISYTQNAPVNPLHPLPAPSFLPYALPLPPPTSSFPYLLYPPPHMIIPAIPESGVDNPEINDPSHAKDVLPIHGNSTTYNLNSLLYNNIMESDYFKALYQLRTYHEVIDEVHASVTHVEPWQAGTSRLASTAFCLLMKFMTLRLTSKQMVGLLETSDSPLVRAIGFLHLRYTAPPATLFGWFEPYLESDEEFSPSADETKRETIGAFCTSLLTNMNYYGTTLPRIPVPIERKIKVMLLLLEEKKKRRRANERIAHKLVKGAKVKAIWGDEENEPAWYEAVVDGRDEESRTRYWVSFPEYGNSACVDLGEIELPTEAISDNDDGGGKYDRNRAEKRGDTRRERSRSRERRRRSDSRDRDRGSRERSSHREQQEGDLLAKVLRDARESSVAQGRNYGNRPTSYKGSLSLKLDRHTVRKRSRSRSPIRERHSREERRSTADRGRSPETGRPSSFTTASTNPANSAATQEQLDRIRKLKERYGDASGERSF